MSWTTQLYQTYEKLSTEDCGLTPIAHMYAKSQLEVKINRHANFVSAALVSKEDERTLIPVTESSSGRSSGSAPHALNDTLSYIAGDYVDYVEGDKEKKVVEKKHSDYMTALEEWCSSDYANSKAILIRDYLQKNSLIADLIKSGLIHVTDRVFAKEKINGQEYAKALVRFCVFDDELEDRTWEDKKLIQDYSQYYLATQKGVQDICYITGQKQTTSENHPKNIVSAYGNAKLISANDTSGYTFRGRFDNSKQAVTISYEASQKIHSALKWLVSSQGRMVGSKNRRMFVTWNPDGKKTGDIMNWSYDMEEDDSYAESQIKYREKLDRMLKGYQEQYNTDDYIILMGLDAATTGRLSVTYYQELLASNYWANISYWGKSVNWYYLKFDQNKKPYTEIETPSLFRIISFAFGTERESNNYKRVEIDDAVAKEHVQRLLKCMIERNRVPRDIVTALYQNASRPLAYTNFNRELLLSTACALIVKAKIDNEIIKEGDEHNMKLDKNNTDRSYLFGRLLAVFEKAEKSAMDKEETRETNAIRLQSTYVNHPAQTWAILEEATKPYFAKLKPGSREYYRQLIAEIVCNFETKDEKKMNQGLSENYLLGYYLQRMELNSKKSNQEENENE